MKSISLIGFGNGQYFKEFFVENEKEFTEYLKVDEELKKYSISILYAAKNSFYSNEDKEILLSKVGESSLFELLFLKKINGKRSFEELVIFLDTDKKTLTEILNKARKHGILSMSQSKGKKYFCATEKGIYMIKSLIYNKEIEVKIVEHK